MYSVLQTATSFTLMVSLNFLQESMNKNYQFTYFSGYSKISQVIALKTHSCPIVVLDAGAQDIFCHVFNLKHLKAHFKAHFLTHQTFMKDLLCARYQNCHRSPQNYKWFIKKTQSSIIKFYVRQLSDKPPTGDRFSSLLNTIKLNFSSNETIPSPPYIWPISCNLFSC